MTENEVLWESSLYTKYLYPLNQNNKLMLIEWHNVTRLKWELSLCENYQPINPRSTLIGSYSGLDAAEKTIEALQRLFA